MPGNQPQRSDRGGKAPPQAAPCQWLDLTETFRAQERRWRRELLPSALLITILVHIVLIIWILNAPPIVALGELPEDAPPVEISLEPIPDFVETNPAAPEATAPETNNTADSTQRSAQPDPLPQDKGRTPTLDGELPDSQKIVESVLEPEPATVPPGNRGAQADSAKPSETPAQPQTPPSPAENIPQLSEPIELPKVSADTSEEGYARSEPPPAVQPPEQPDASQIQPPPGEPVPLPRPQVQIRRPPAPLRESVGGVSQLGVVAIDAKFSEFGAYQQRMMEAVSLQWNLLASRYNFTSRDMGTSVEVSFKLDMQGVISDFSIESSSASRAATLLCQDAVISRAPFGVWTEQMVRMLGESTPVRIRFFYR